MAKVAVIGAGIFGCHIALELGRRGVDVSLYEKNWDILGGATAVNQFRLHRGYHYPRSHDTMIACKRSAEKFVNHYGGCVETTGDHYYGIANCPTSRVSPGQYLKALDDVKLEYALAVPDFVYPDTLSFCIRAHEASINSLMLRNLIWRELYDTPKVVRRFSTAVDESNFEQIHDDNDYVIVCGYAHNGNILKLFGIENSIAKHELVLKLGVRLKSDIVKRSLVVMDGPFCSFDWWYGSDMYLLGHVFEAIVAEDETATKTLSMEDYYHRIPDRAEAMVNASAKFIPALEDCEIVRKMLVHRVVPNGVDDTDERPTQVIEHGNDVVSVFSGKIGTCIEAAEEVIEICGL